MAYVFYPGTFTGRPPGQGEAEVEHFDKLYVPDAAARKRLEGYYDADKLLDLNKHYDLYNEDRQGTTGQDTKKHWIPLDMPGMLTRLMRHYTLGAEFQIRAKLRGQTTSGAALVAQQTDGQAIVDRITKGSNLDYLLRQVAEQLPAYGDAVLRVDLEDKEDDTDGTRMLPTAVVRYVKPQYYFPTLDPTDGSRLLGVTLAWTLPDTRQDADNTQGRAVVLREVHVPGYVSYFLNTFDGNGLGADIPVSSMFPHLEDHETGIDEIPVVHFGYDVRAGEHFGHSELERVKAIILALENRLAQEDEVLEKHARPKLVVGPGILDAEGRTSLHDFDVIEVAPDIFEKMVKPDYLTWDMQVQGIQHEIEKLEEYLFMTTETSPASFGLERDGSQVESARALRFKAHRTVNKVEDLRTAITPSIEAVYRIAQKLEIAERAAQGLDGSGYRRVDIAVRYGDPIVEDQAQEVQDYVLRKNSGLVSRRRALMDLDNLNAAEAEAEVSEILQDQVDEAAATTATLQGGEFGEEPERMGRGAEEAEEDTEESPDLRNESGLSVAQVASLVAVVKETAAGNLPRDSALAIISTAFGLSDAEAAKLLGDAGTPSFRLASPAPAPSAAPLVGPAE